MKTKLLDYPFNSEKMCDQFVDIFEKIYQEKIIYQKNKPISIQGKIFLNSIYLRRYFNLTNFLNAIRTRIKKALKMNIKSNIEQMLDGVSKYIIMLQQINDFEFYFTHIGLTDDGKNVRLGPSCYALKIFYMLNLG